MSAEQFPSSGEKKMSSYEIRTSRHDPRNIIAVFPGMGLMTFMFDAESHDIVHEAFEASDTEERKTAERVLGSSRLANAREAAILHYNIEHPTPLPAESSLPHRPATQQDLFAN